MEKTMETLNGATATHGEAFQPVAFFICDKKNPYEASRQGTSAANENEIAEVRFSKGSAFEQALDGIEGCTHLWLIYQFHKNNHWNPKVQPPRGACQKMGVFATRSPYRPNQIGMSCVELVQRKGLSLFVKKFDLLDGTPILDVKPYLAYSDSFPEAKIAWLEGIEAQKLDVQFSNRAQEQLLWLESRGLDQFRNFIVQQLEFDPLNAKKKRLRNKAENSAILCYRTWRADFTVINDLVVIEKIFSGYTNEDLQKKEDPYLDKDLHRVYLDHRLQN
jgi:tRNA-Thr(GGU) m(6)t(6)A37 methyltransferase TsaA